MEDSKPTEKVKHHYHLVVAELVFKPNDQELINAVRMNGMIVTEKREIGQKELGKAQQVVQFNFYRKLEEEGSNVTVVDVVIMNLVHLGHMTEEDFYKTPEGTKMAEKKEPTLAAVPDLETAVAQASASANEAATTADEADRSEQT